MQFLRKASTGINLGWKPQLLGYGSIISGIVSVPLALFLIYFLDWSIIGIVFSLAIAEGANIIFQVVCAREKIKAKIDFAILKRWFKFSWVPLYPKISNLLVMSDVIVFSLITGSVIGVSYHSAALVIAILVGYAAAISASVYPKLLSGDKGKIITRNLTNFFYFAILLVFLATAFAKPGLFILNPIYEIAVLVVIFSTFRILFFYLTNICESFLIGVENVDNESKSNFKDYMKSKLFFLPTLRLIQYAVYIVVLTIVLVFALPVSERAKADIPDETFEVLGLDPQGDPAELYDALEWRYHDPEEGAGEGSLSDFWDPILFSKYTNPNAFYEPPDKGKGSGRQGCVECHEKDTRHASE